MSNLALSTLSYEEIVEGTLIDSPEEFARLLLSLAPGRAENFAKAEHEKACWNDFSDRAEFWANVSTAISRLQSAIGPRRP